MTMIEDGTGTGRKAKVSQLNQLEVLSVMMPSVRYINLTQNLTWAFPLDAVAPSGATWFCVFFNSGTTTYVFSRLVITSSVAGVIRISKVTGTPAGGTVLIPVNLFISSSKQLDLAVMQTAASITGLTESALIVPIYCPAGQPISIETGPGIIVPPGTSGLALKAPAAATINGFIEIYQESLVDGG